MPPDIYEVPSCLLDILKKNRPKQQSLRAVMFCLLTLLQRLTELLLIMTENRKGWLNVW